MPRDSAIARIPTPLDPHAPGNDGEWDQPCAMCEEIGSGFGPTHNGSKYCESGSIASGGDRAHCTCDRCF